MMVPNVRPAALLLLAGAAFPLLAQQPLELNEVLLSVERSFPLLDSAFQERDLAQGAQTAAQGEFDLKLKAQGSTEQVGFYRNETFKGLLEQPTTLQGATVYGGYRVGRGTYGPYDEKALTLSGGEWAGGFNLPLFRNRAIDQRRADLVITALGRDAAEFSIQKQRLTIYKAAIKQYWDWVAAGRQLEVVRALLGLAEQRNQQLQDSVDLGQVAPVELTDNQRAILQRQSALVGADRLLQNATIELSLFLRDAAGQPQLVSSDRLLTQFPDPQPLTEQQELDDIAFAISQRPEVRSYLVKRSQQERQIAVADNQVLPQLDVFFDYSRDLGSGRVSRQGNEVRAGLNFELPAQRRKAFGKQTQENAKLRQIDAELRFARDRVTADVRDAASALRAAYNAVGVIGQEVEAARKLEEAERARFELGDSTQFMVNLRELATADASFRLIKALADYNKARGDYEAATSRILNRVPPRTP
jgi:outer membrane protein, heavy metal efflux system